MGRRGWRCKRLLVVLSCAGLLWGSPRSVHAAACCMSATATGIGRLLIWERFAVGLRSSVVGGIGAWDQHGDWRAYDAQSYREVDWRSSLWTIVGLGRRWSLYGELPWVVSYRRTGNLGESVAGGLADVQLGARHELLGIGEWLDWPAIALTGTVRLPTGRTVEAAGAGGSGVTSRGAWALAGGLTLEQTYLPFFLRLDLGLVVPMPRDQGGRSLRFGVGLQTALSGGVELWRGIVVSLTLRYGWEDALRYDGEAVPESARSDAGVGLALSWRVSPHWTVQAGADSGLFVGQFGDNTPGRITGTVGLRYGYF